MSNCKECHFAVWRKTKTGKLHPSGEGKCTCKPWEKWQIPVAYYYIHSRKIIPPEGGYINRRTPHEGKCPFFQHIKPDAS